MNAIINCRVFCLPVYYPKIQRLKYTELYFCPLFCLGVKLVSHIREGRVAEGVREYGAEEAWAYKECGKRKAEKTA
jgi:hypothetical protein